MALATLFVGHAFAQEPGEREREREMEGAAPQGKRLTKTEERLKFHPSAVRGMSAKDWLTGYDQFVRLKADSPFSALKWRNIGPETQGGRVLDIKAPKDHPERLFVAYATGGLWTTDDDGASWKSLFDNQSAFGIGAIAVSRDGSTIWVGSGEANSQRTSYAGTGIFKSTDGGKTWQNMGLNESHHIGQVLIDPRNPNVVYVAALGHLYSQNPERGVYKTTDGGKTWSQVLKVDEFTGAVDLVISPKNPDILMASMWDRDRRAWNFRESGKGSGVYRSVNGGKSWTKVRGLPEGEAAGRTGLALCESKPNVVYAFVDNQGEDEEWATQDEFVVGGRLTARRFLRLNTETLGKLDAKVLEPFLRSAVGNDLKAEDVLKQVQEGKLTYEQLKEKIEEKKPDFFGGEITGDEIYRSDDGGVTWKKTETPRFGTIGGYYWGKVWVNPANPDDVYTMGLPLMHSTDGGKTWASVAEQAHVDHHAVWNDPRDPRKVWIGNDGGLYVSYDSGKTVRPVNNLGVGQATTIAVDDKRPYNVYIGLQDNGTMRGPSNYRPGISDPNAWKDIGGGDGSWVAVDPRNGGDVVYGASQFGNHYALNQATNERWGARANAGREEAPLRYNWISPLIISAHHADILYLGANKLFRSFDQGRHWTAISPDLTKDKPNGDVPFSTLKDVSESPLKFGLVYTGADDGTVKMTPDGGVQWFDISTPQKDKWVTRVVASRYDEKVVYVAQSGYREDDFAPYLWKSNDQGKSWTSIVGNLPNQTINVVREDPNRKDILYVGTDMGVYVSFDGGKLWETLPGGLPNTPVHDLTVQARDKELVIASHARSVWALPLKWVYELTPELRKEDLKVLELEDARRSANWGMDRKEKWDTTPPRVPATDITFYSKAAGAAVIRVKDKDGKVIIEKKFDAVRGFNFTSFDLQLEGPKKVKPATGIAKTVEEALADPFGEGRPKFIAVGDYKVELSVGDKLITRDWKVKE